MSYLSLFLKATMISIPLTVDDINTEFMQNVLATRYKDIKVWEAKTERGTQPGDNFSSDMYRCYVTGQKGDEDFSKSYMVKVSSCDGSRGNIVLKDTLLYDFESDAYTKVFETMRKLSEGKVNLPFPDYVYSNRDDVAGVLILEDLRSKGYTMATEKFQQSLEESKNVVDAYARLHALGYKLKFTTKKPLEQEYPKLFHNFLEKHGDMIRQLMSTGHKTLVKLISAYPQFEPNVEALKNKGDIIEEVLKEFLPTSDSLSTIIHGDSNSNNFLFLRDSDSVPNDCKVVDFEGLVLGNPYRDLVCYLQVSISPQLRKTHLTEILQVYHRKLIETLDLLNVTELTEEERSFETVKRLYTEGALSMGFYMGMIMVPFLLLMEDDISALYGGDFFQNVTNLMDKLGTRSPEKYKYVNERLIASMEEMIEYGFI